MSHSSMMSEVDTHVSPQKTIVASESLVTNRVEKTVVLYDISMLYLQAERVDIFILEHKSAECIEVIAYSPSMNVEAPRIYLNSEQILIKIQNVLDHKKENPNNENSLKFPVADEHLISYITSRLKIFPCGTADSPKFTIHMCAVRETDVIIYDKQEHTERLDIEYKTKPEFLVPFETYRPRNKLNTQKFLSISQEFISVDTLNGSITEQKAESSVEMFMNYHYNSLCDSTAISAFAQILRGQDGRMEQFVVLAQNTKNSENMHHVRLNNSELYKKADFAHDATPTYHVVKIKESLRHAPGMCHILEVEQQSLLGAAATECKQSAETKLHKLAVDVSKTYRKSFLSAAVSKTINFGRHSPPTATSMDATAEHHGIDAEKLAWLKLFWDSIDMHTEEENHVGEEHKQLIPMHSVKEMPKSAMKLAHEAAREKALAHKESMKELHEQEMHETMSQLHARLATSETPSNSHATDTRSGQLESHKEETRTSFEHDISAKLAHWERIQRGEDKYDCKNDDKTSGKQSPSHQGLKRLNTRRSSHGDSMFHNYNTPHSTPHNARPVTENTMSAIIHTATPKPHTNTVATVDFKREREKLLGIEHHDTHQSHHPPQKTSSSSRRNSLNSLRSTSSPKHSPRFSQDNSSRRNSLKNSKQSSPTDVPLIVSALKNRFSPQTISPLSHERAVSPKSKFKSDENGVGTKNSVSFTSLTNIKIGSTDTTDDLDDCYSDSEFVDSDHEQSEIFTANTHSNPHSPLKFKCVSMDSYDNKKSVTLPVVSSPGQRPQTSTKRTLFSISDNAVSVNEGSVIANNIGSTATQQKVQLTVQQPCNTQNIMAYPTNYAEVLKQSQLLHTSNATAQQTSSHSISSNKTTDNRVQIATDHNVSHSPTSMKKSPQNIKINDISSVGKVEKNEDKNEKKRENSPKKKHKRGENPLHVSNANKYGISPYLQTKINPRILWPERQTHKDLATNNYDMLGICRKGTTPLFPHGDIIQVSPARQFIESKYFMEQFHKPKVHHKAQRNKNNSPFYMDDVTRQMRPKSSQNSSLLGQNSSLVSVYSPHTSAHSDNRSGSSRDVSPLMKNTSSNSSFYTNIDEKSSLTDHIRAKSATNRRNIHSASPSNKQSRAKSAHTSINNDRNSISPSKRSYFDPQNSILSSNSTLMSLTAEVVHIEINRTRAMSPNTLNKVSHSSLYQSTTRSSVEYNAHNHDSYRDVSASPPRSPNAHNRHHSNNHTSAMRTNTSTTAATTTATTATNNLYTNQSNTIHAHSNANMMSDVQTAVSAVVSNTANNTQLSMLRHDSQHSLDGGDSLEGSLKSLSSGTSKKLRRPSTSFSAADFARKKRPVQSAKQPRTQSPPKLQQQSGGSASKSFSIQKTHSLDSTDHHLRSLSPSFDSTMRPKTSPAISSVSILFTPHMQQANQQQQQQLRSTSPLTNTIIPMMNNFTLHSGSSFSDLRQTSVTTLSPIISPRSTTGPHLPAIHATSVKEVQSPLSPSALSRDPASPSESELLVSPTTSPTMVRKTRSSFIQQQQEKAGLARRPSILNTPPPIRTSFLVQNINKQYEPLFSHAEEKR